MPRYFMLYKPFDMLSQFTKEVPEQSTLADIAFDFPKDVYPVGRLDKDSEGLLLLTNDKKLTERLLNPKYQHPRTYWVQVEKTPDKEALEQLQKGVIISVDGRDYRTLPAAVRLLDEAPALPDRNPPIRYRAAIPTAWLSLSLIEGKNRQVRKMTAKVGFPTLRLVRCQIGDLSLSDLQPAQVRELSEQEIYKVLLEGRGA
jgi:23S rRNA pseudouridine2457 synthase